jgi:hypothetical protein
MSMHRSGGAGSAQGGCRHRLPQRTGARSLDPVDTGSGDRQTIRQASRTQQEGAMTRTLRRFHSLVCARQVVDNPPSFDT